MRAVLLPLLALACCLGAPVPVRAAESYDNCRNYIDTLPAVITTQGVWCLRKHLSTALASGHAIEVQVNNVTIDCNDFKIGGLSAGLDTQAIGIYALGRTNVTVANCGIRGFHDGIALAGDSRNALVEYNRFDQNTFRAIYVQGPGALIRGNRVLDTGGSTMTPLARGIDVASVSCEILDNDIRGVLARVGGNGPAIGIRAISTGCKIVGNRVHWIDGDGPATAYGIFASSTRAILADNQLSQAGDNGVGLDCASDTSVAKGNVLGGFDTPIDTCIDSDNHILP
jgi:hypothetical protein